MAHSVVKVTDPQLYDRLLLVVGADGTVTPDKETVKTYLNSKPEGTEFEVMHVNKIGEDDIDVSLETLVYVRNEEAVPDMGDLEEISRNLHYFRMDHDYTPLTSPKRTSPAHETEVVDELAQTLSILDGNQIDLETVQATKLVKRMKSPVKIKRVVAVTSTPQTKVKAKMIATANASTRQHPKQQKLPLSKFRSKDSEDDEDSYDEEEDEDYLDDLDEDEDDSDFELEEIPKQKIRSYGRGRTKSQSTEAPHTPIPRAGRIKLKTIAPKPVQTKTALDTPKVSKPLEPPPELKPLEKKQPPKKEKKPPKPIPDDFALFSTPDIIRRVGGKQEMPTTPTTPETPKPINPMKITQENRSKSNSIDSKTKRLSIDAKPLDKQEKYPSKDRRNSEGSNKTKKDEKERRSSTDVKKPQNPDAIKTGHVLIKDFNATSGSNSSNSGLEAQLEPLPNSEDIRAIIHSDPAVLMTAPEIIPPGPNDQNMGLETNLELDQSLLENINSDFQISEDILYQVAQSLADNTELQNVIDKSIVDGNLVLDPSIQHTISQENNLMHQSQMDQVNLTETRNADSTKTGTQIVRPDGRIVVIPPIERPTTRSRNKRQEPETTKPTLKFVHKLLDEEHVSGNELDSSESEKDEDEDDPDKLWCICNQPHNNRFMICCDTCEEWYHGKCVNVTKAMGQMMEQEGKEWICCYCKDSSLKRPSAAARRIRKASRTSTDSASSIRKSASVSTTSLTESKSSAPACIVCGKVSRNNSVYCSDSCILKHAQGVEKVVVFERRTGKILSGSHAPSAANLEKWLQEHPGFEVVRSTSKPQAIKQQQQQNFTQSKLRLVKNASNEGVSLAVHKKGINIGILQHTPKESQSPPIILNKHAKKFSDLKIITKSISPSPNKTKIIQPLPISKPTTPTTPIRVKTIQTTIKTFTPANKDKQTPQKVVKIKPESTSAPATPKQENIRENVKKTLFEQLTSRLKMTEDLKLTEEEVTNISSEIESQLYKCFGDTSQKYRNKYRSLIFNIKDVKNQTLWRRICEKSINPYQLVRLSPDDLASQELALWRERETKHQLDMIKKSELELLNCNRQYVFKTHKGEQVFEDDRPKETVDSTEVIAGLGADSTSTESSENKKDSKEKDKKSSKHRRDQDRSRERGKSRERERSRDRKSSRDKERRRRSSSKDRDRHKRSRSRDRSKHDKKRSKSKDRERHKRSHRSSRHKKENHNTTDKLDKKSKEILEQLVDKQIVPPLEDRLWKHVPQDDLMPAPSVESDSDHEPSSTVTIPTPPQNVETETEEVAKNSFSEPAIEAKATEENVKSCLPLPPVSKESDDSSEEATTTEPVWKGCMNMVDVAQISIVAHEISGDCRGLGEELAQELDIVGRIIPETVWEYISKMKCSSSKSISLLELHALNVEEKMPYLALYSYLTSRKRLGVIRSTNKAVKDFYIMPLVPQTPLPTVLQPFSLDFEENKGPSLLGIIVRDHRKRPLSDTSQPSTSKKVKVEISTPPAPLAPGTPPRSYTPPPTRDPRLKTPFVAPPLPLPETTKETEAEEDEDMDEPYSPEDSDPDTVDPPIIVPPIKTNTFLDTSLPTQTFEPFSNKFDTIPGLEDAAVLPSSSQELQRKMAELDQKIALQKAEIDNMSQDIVSSASTDIGTSALANIALPSNLQQILDSIKTIGAVSDTVPSSTNDEASGAKDGPDLTIPLMLPKISSRPLTGSAARQDSSTSSPTIPLNLPKIKSKTAPTNSPMRPSEPEKPAISVLSSLSEEDLIRKAAEMLGESEALPKKPKETSSFQPPPVSSFIPSLSPVPLIFNKPPPSIGPPPPIISSLINPPPPKRSKIDLNQPPVPGLEDET